MNRVLISDDFIYFGGTGPAFPDDLQDENGRPVCKRGIGRSCFNDPQLVKDLERWIRSLGVRGFKGPPQEWISLRD